MSENNLSDIISSLAANKDFASMVERVKESGDLGSILGEVASLLGTQGEKDGISAEISSAQSAPKEAQGYDTSSIADTSDGEAFIKELHVDNARENDESIGYIDDASFSRAENEDRHDGEENSNPLDNRSSKDGRGGFDTSSLLGSILPFLSKSIAESSGLLLALKPYLSKKRCDLIDNIIKLSRLASIVSLAK